MTEPIEQAGRTGAQECRGTEVVCGPLQAGAQVTVYHVAMIQRPLIEGTAIVLGVFDEARDLYWVRFAGEGRGRRHDSTACTALTRSSRKNRRA